ncbi:MAG: hypothetical protein P8Y45_19945 [Exilibacterium sp.]
MGATLKNKGPWQVGCSYLDQTSDLNVATGAADRVEDVETAATTVQFQNQHHKFAMRYQQEDWEVSEEFTTMGAYYAFTTSRQTIFHARIYNLDRGDLNGNQISAGVAKKFGKYGEVFAEYTDYDDDAAILKGRGDDITIGYKINF